MVNNTDNHVLPESQLQDDEIINVRKIANKVISLWPWALLWSGILILLSFTYLYFATPTYHVNAAMLIKYSNSSGGGGAASSSSFMTMESMGLVTGASSVYNEQQILQGYTLMNEVVHQMQLNVQYFVSNGLRSLELYGDNLPFNAKFSRFQEDSLRANGPLEYDLTIKKDKTGLIISDKYTGKTQSVSWYDTVNLTSGRAVFVPNHSFVGTTSGNEYSMLVANSDGTTAAYMKILTLTIPDLQASVIDMTLDLNLPDKGEAVLRHLINTYIQANVEDNNRVADSTMAFIDGRLVIVSEQLAGIEKQIQSFKQNNAIADMNAQSTALIQNTSYYAQQLTAQQVQLSVIKSLQQYILSNKENPRIVPASLMIQDPTLSNIISRYNDLLLQRSRLMLNATESNPVVQNLDQQISSLRSDLSSGIASVKKSAEVALSMLQAHQGNMQAQIQKVPAKERVFLDFSRKQDVLQQLYLFLLQTREETAISKSSTVSNARIIDPPKSDIKPYWPLPILILPIAFLLGFCIPFGYTYARDLLNNKVTTRQEIENETNVPIVGEIRHNPELEFIAIEAGSRSIISEQFRALRTNLQFLLTDQKKKVVMITSSMSSEGKSFISTNLAMALAISGKKVLLMEMDLRKPKISSSINLETKYGFSNYVIGQVSEAEIIYPSGIDDNVFVIPAGSIPPNPAELILHERTEKLFEHLIAQFDYILVDTPPNLVTDAQLLAHYADATLYVVRLGVTHKDQIKIPNNLARGNKMPHLSLVVNDIKQKRGKGYYGYGKGTDGYGYGDYLDDKGKKRKRKKAVTD